jgi:hypothetical protein
MNSIRRHLSYANVQEGTGRFGFRMAWTLNSLGDPGEVGTYTVTAP